MGGWDGTGRHAPACLPLFVRISSFDREVFVPDIDAFDVFHVHRLSEVPDERPAAVLVIGRKEDAALTALERLHDGAVRQLDADAGRLGPIALKGVPMDIIIVEEIYPIWSLQILMVLFKVSYFLRYQIVREIKSD